MVVSKGWGHEVRGSGWAPGKSRARADWVREEEYLEEKAKGWIKRYGCRASKREREREATCVGGGRFLRLKRGGVNEAKTQA